MVAEKEFSVVCVVFCSIPVDIRKAVYRSVISTGNDDDWDFLWNVSQSTEVASEKYQILLSLANTRDAWRIQRYAIL